MQEKTERGASLTEYLSRVIELPQAHCFLRLATHRLHHRIDRTSVLTALTNPAVTLPLYVSAMQALQRAYRQIDSLLVMKAELCPAGLPSYMARVPSIDRDLIALRARGSEGLGTQAGWGLQAPESEAAYLGMRYVVEGAQLGSRLIHRHLHGVFGDELHAIGSFWTLGSALQSSWPEVLKGLARLESRESLAAAARAARRTFGHMALHLAAGQTEAR